MPAPAPLVLSPDRLLPADPEMRAVARRLYDTVRDLPILSPHGHVDARLLVDDAPFRDPATLLVTPDHYVTRLLHASGVPLSALGLGRTDLDDRESSQVWRTLCANWTLFRGTPSRYWLETTLAEVFDVAVRPSAETADDLYDQIAQRLAKDDYRPRALFDRFGIEVLATTDDPCDDLTAHAILAADQDFRGRVLPTFRPDRYLEVAAPGWIADVARLAEVSGVDTGSYAGWVGAMEQRRAHFGAHGAVSADHSHEDVGTQPMTDPERAYRRALAGSVHPADAAHRRAGHRARHPAARGLHRPAAPAAGALRHAPGSAPGAVHPGRDGVQPGTRTAGRLLPLRLRRCALVVPRRTGGGAPVPRRGHRDGRLLPHVGVHR